MEVAEGLEKMRRMNSLLLCLDEMYGRARMGRSEFCWGAARVRQQALGLVACWLAASSWVAVACKRDAGKASPATTQAATARTALAPGELCPAMFYFTLSVSVSDPTTARPICDAEVTAVDQSGKALALLPSPDGCERIAYEGREATFTVSARKPGYAEASQRVVMRKLPCQFSAPSVHFALKPSAAHQNTEPFNSE